MVVKGLAGAGPGRVRSSGGSPGSGAGAGAVQAIEELRVLPTLKWFRRQSLGYWIACLYIFLEYVRPQAMYPVLTSLPWSMYVLVTGVLVLLFKEHPRRPWNIADTGLLVYSLVLLASIPLAYRPSVALTFDSLNYYFSWVIGYWLISTVVTTRGRFIFFLLLFFAWNLKMAQHAARSWAAVGFGFDQFIVGAPGWFHNSGEMGIAMVMFLPLSITLLLALKGSWPTWKKLAWLALPGSALVAIAASASRGAQVALAVVGFWFLLRSRYKVRGALVAVLGLLALYAMLPERQRDRLGAMGEDQTSQQRITYWRNGIVMMKRHPLLGVGYKNWVPYYRDHFEGRVQVSHNIFIQAGSELGFTGLGAFLFLIAATLAINGQTRKQLTKAEGKKAPLIWVAHGFDSAMIGYLVAGSFVTVLYYPFFWINLAMSVSFMEATRPRKGPSAYHGVKGAQAVPASSDIGAVFPA